MTTKPTCDMVAGCLEPITHIDSKGFIYCKKHGLQRQYTHRCRQLRAAELRLIEKGEPIHKF